jgi:predicted transposase/invertase (TIGR01784 family)
MELKHKFTDDVLFKMLFVKVPVLLKKLVAELLGLSLESIEEFDIRNPETPPENLGDKFCRLDINMTVNGQRVDLEVQVNDEGDFPERSLYYWAREYSSALLAGQNNTYSSLPKTIIISIVNFKMFNCAEFHSEFHALEVTRHTELTDKFCMHYFELPKLPITISKDDRLQLWLALFKAKTEEELKQIELMEVEDMEQAIEAYKQVTVMPEFKEAERLRQKARLDEAQALQNKAIKIAKNMLADGDTIEKVVRVTELPREEVEKLV